MGGEDYVTICVRLDGDLARWLRRVSRSLPYSEEEVIKHLLRSFRDTWLLVESAVKNAGEVRASTVGGEVMRKLGWVKKHKRLVLEFMKWLGAGGKQLMGAGIDDVKAFLSTKGVANKGTFEVYKYALKCAIDLAKSGVDLEKILNTGGGQ